MIDMSSEKLKKSAAKHKAFCSRFLISSNNQFF